MGNIARWTIHNPSYEGGIATVQGPPVNDTTMVVGASEYDALQHQLRGAVKERDWFWDALLIACDNDKERAARFMRMARSVTPGGQ